MFPEQTKDLAAKVLDGARAAGVRITTVETVTSGLVAAALTSVSGASSIVERGYILYHDSAKATGLGVSEEVSRTHGAVSAAVTQGLADGGLAHSTAGISIAVTGYAGPTGGNEKDPVGTCYVALARTGHDTVVERHSCAGDRDSVRLAAVNAALSLAIAQCSDD